jgi:hypothetical protein
MSTAPIGPIDTALYAALGQNPEALLGEASRNALWVTVRVAMAPMGVQWRSGTPLLDGGKVAWNAVHAELVRHVPTSAWPMGFTLRAEQDRGAWRPWRLSKVYAFGATLNERTAGLTTDSWRSWSRGPIGLDALCATLHKLDRVWSPSNQAPRSWAQAHNMMGSPFMCSDRVVARTELEALVKFAWLRGGWDGLREAATEKDRNHRTWLVANGIADPDGDGFALPPTLDAVRADLAARLAGVAP